MAQVRSENVDGDLFRQSLACRLVTVVGKPCMKVKNNSVTLFSNLHCERELVGSTDY